MSKLDTVVISVVIALATSWATSRALGPSLNFRFEPAYPMVISAEQRSIYGDDAIAVKIETDGVLKNASVRLLAISTKPDLSDPLNGFVEPTFGWPIGQESFLPRMIGGQDYIIIATEEKSGGGGKNLRFFFNEFYGAPGLENKPVPEIEFLKSLNFGTYYMQIALLSESTKPLLGKFKITWSTPDKFEMSVIK